MTPDLFDNGTASAAVISDCGKYRYRLTRTWDKALPSVVFVMLNPSTASATVDDPTIRRVIGFAKSWSCGGIEVVNLFALRATDPREVYKHEEPVGPDNDRTLLEVCRSADILVCAWGAHGRLRGRDARVKALIRQVGVPAHHLGLTGTGQPKHPLYLSGKLTPQLWGF